jgi:hypothetical protein
MRDSQRPYLTCPGNFNKYEQLIDADDIAPRMKIPQSGTRQTCVVGDRLMITCLMTIIGLQAAEIAALTP